MSQAIPITSLCLVLTEFEQEKVRLTPCRLMFYFHFLDGKNMFFFNVHSAQMDRCVNRFDKLSTWHAGSQTLMMHKYLSYFLYNKQVLSQSQHR